MSLSTNIDPNIHLWGAELQLLLLTLQHYANPVAPLREHISIIKMCMQVCVCKH